MRHNPGNTQRSIERPRTIAQSNAPAGGGGLGSFRHAKSLGAHAWHADDPFHLHPAKLAAGRTAHQDAELRIEYTAGARAAQLTPHSQRMLTDILRAAGLRKAVVCGVSDVDATGHVQVVELRGKAGEHAAVADAASGHRQVEVLRAPSGDVFRIEIPQ